MDFQLNNAVEILERTPKILRAWLSGLGDCWVRTNYSEGTFSPYDVLGHLIHGEKTDWIPRAKIILTQGTSRPFDTYDRYAQFENSRGKSVENLLDEFDKVRAESIAALKQLQLTESHLNLQGRHQALGTVTLSQLLSTWVVHDLNHLSQIAKCMATQYKQAVGPWIEYLTILDFQPVQMTDEGKRRRQAVTNR